MGWCGDQPQEYEDGIVLDTHDCHQLTCLSCGMQVDYASDDMKQCKSIAETRELVARKWNTRAAPSGVWISVEDRLPEDIADGEMENTILIFMPGLIDDKSYPGHPVMVSNRVYATNQAKLGNVSHWMPLPEPPKGEG